MVVLNEWCRVLVLAAVLFVHANSVQLSEEKDAVLGSTGGRGMREDFPIDQWRAVQQLETSGWVASDGEQPQQQPRRRLRKRKRRPQANAQSETITPNEETVEEVRPRRRRPVRLDEARDTWKELEAETPKRTYHRRRVGPVYGPNAGVASATITFGEEAEDQREISKEKKHETTSVHNKNHEEGKASSAHNRNHEGRTEEGKTSNVHNRNHEGKTSSVYNKNHEGRTSSTQNRSHEGRTEEAKSTSVHKRNHEGRTTGEGKTANVYNNRDHDGRPGTEATSTRLHSRYNEGRIEEVTRTGEEAKSSKQNGERVVVVGRRKRLRTTTTTPPPASVVDIKNLIKQNSGMSLSEILQKKNLSLSDLLKGKQQAISALSAQEQQQQKTDDYEDWKEELKRANGNTKQNDYEELQIGNDEVTWTGEDEMLEEVIDWTLDEGKAKRNKWNAQEESKLKQQGEETQFATKPKTESDMKLKQEDVLTKPESKQEDAPISKQKAAESLLSSEVEDSPMKVMLDWFDGDKPVMLKDDSNANWKQHGEESIPVKANKWKPNEPKHHQRRPYETNEQRKPHENRRPIETTEQRRPMESSRPIETTEQRRPIENSRPLETTEQRRPIEYSRPAETNEQRRPMESTRPVETYENYPVYAKQHETYKPLLKQQAQSYEPIEIPEEHLYAKHEVYGPPKLETNAEYKRPVEHTTKVVLKWGQTIPGDVVEKYLRTRTTVRPPGKVKTGVDGVINDGSNSMRTSLDGTPTKVRTSLEGASNFKTAVDASTNFRAGLDGSKTTLGGSRPALDGSSKVKTALDRIKTGLDALPKKNVPEWIETKKPEQPATIGDKYLKNYQGNSGKEDQFLKYAKEHTTYQPKQDKIVFDSMNEADFDKDILDAQRKRIGILYKSNGHKIVSDFTTESSDKRIYVPSHPKYYTSLNYKPDFSVDAILKTTTSSNAEETSTKANVRSKLPVTSAKIMKHVKGGTTLPPKAIKISLSELLANKENEGPLKMLFDLEELVSNTVIPTEVNTPQPELDPEVIHKPELDPEVDPEVAATTAVSAKMRPVSAKDEIMEILRDELTKENLERILQRRNMTVEELVEQRERGSSQRHLADIFHNKTKEPEATMEHVAEIKVMRKGKLYEPPREKLNLQEISDVSMSSEEIITSERVPGTSFPTYKIENTQQHAIPIWKTVYNTKDHKPIIEQIENTISEAVNEELTKNKDPNNNTDYDEYVQLPLGVKSAIFASLAIVAISIVVFLTILIIFKWAQQQKQRLCYNGTFKSPILQAEARKSLRTFVSETLGRKRSVYTSRLQSMSDSWDSDKPYQ